MIRKCRILRLCMMLFVGVTIGAQAEHNQLGLSSSFNWRSEIGVFYAYHTEPFSFGAEVSYSGFDAGIATYSQLPVDVFVSYRFDDIKADIQPFLKLGGGYEMWSDEPDGDKNLYYKPIYESCAKLFLSAGVGYRSGNFLYSGEIGIAYRNAELELQEKVHPDIKFSISYIF